MNPRSKVLIVDDEPEVGEILGVLLEEQFDCEIFTDATRALEALRKQDFPLIINVEVRYNPEQKRVIYEPVSIEPRVLVPRTIRDDADLMQAKAEAADDWQRN